MGTSRREPLSLGRVVLTVVGVAIGLVALGAIAFVVLFSLALAPRDGAAIARGQVEDRARAIEEHLGYWYDTLDAETLAAWHFTSSDSDTVRPFAWAGATDADDGADIDVVIRMTVGPNTSGGLFQASVTPGSAEGCFRYHVRNTENVSFRRIDCPAALPSIVPTPAPGLAADAEDQLRATLLSADAATLNAAVRAVFSRPDITVDTSATAAGELVAAVGVAVSRDCIVLVRRTDAEVERIAFDPIQLEPGELGCSAALYTAPAR